MNQRSSQQTDIVQTYLDTGDHDPSFAGWPGNTFLEIARDGSNALREALIREVRTRTSSALVPRTLPANEVRGLTRVKVAPMVAGLFPAAEQPAVLNVVEQSVVFLRPETIETVLRSTPWLRTIWSLANLYLVSLNCEPLSTHVPPIVGLSQGTTCYVCLDYWEHQDEFADYIVHEAAHIFHNAKRTTVGLPQRRRSEWLLDIDYRKRETFAYACEAYSRILAISATPLQRRAALAHHAAGALPPDPLVDHDEYLDILTDAVRARNGWKRILRRCAPLAPSRSRLQAPYLSTMLKQPL